MNYDPIINNLSNLSVQQEAGEITHLLLVDANNLELEAGEVTHLLIVLGLNAVEHLTEYVIYIADRQRSIFPQCMVGAQASVYDSTEYKHLITLQFELSKHYLRPHINVCTIYHMQIYTKGEIQFVLVSCSEHPQMGSKAKDS